MSDTVTISVAMATYNGERFIREQLDSLARQTYLPCELIVSDDRSSDRTLSIVNEFANTAPFPVRVYQNPITLGAADNFLKAAKLCSGNWIAFCDQDDVWFETKLERIQGAIKENPSTLLVTHSAIVVDELLRPTGSQCNKLSDRVIKPLKGHPWFSPHGFAIVFDASLVRDFDGKRRPPSFDLPSIMMLHDLWIYFLASVLGKIVHLAEPLAFYRRHDQTVTNSGKQVKVKQPSIRAVLKTGAEYYNNHSRIIYEYANCLNRLTENSDEIYRHRLKEGAEFYERIAQAFKKRGVIYEDTCFVRKVVASAQLLASGSYRYLNLRGNPVAPFIKDIVYVITSLFRLNKLLRASVRE